MSEERLKEIKDNANRDFEYTNYITLKNERNELYNEVIRLREIIDKLERWTNKHFIGTLGDTFIHKIEELKNEEK